MQQGCRTKQAEYPDYSGEIRKIQEEGVSARLVGEIIDKHRANATFNRALHQRYKGSEVPIYKRRPRYDQDAAALNNKLSNDFFGEIIDFKTGYFAGSPIGYNYSFTVESEEETGLDAARNPGEVDAADKMLTDFVVRNNMFDVDMECTKLASCCGYAARLFYHDAEGNERVMMVPPYEAVILARTDITEPFAGVRYYEREGDGKETVLHVEYYDNGDRILLFKGSSADALEPDGELENLFDLCPLQGIPNNGEMIGDVEKVLSLMDAYDRALSDANNENEGFANAYMLFENVNLSEEEIRAGQRSGAFQFWNGGAGNAGKISFLTKDANDNFVEHHLNRLQNNIYRFSKTPDLSDMQFGQNASGVSLKFKLIGLETKCGMLQAKLQSAGVYMFRLLAGCWQKKGLHIDPLQCVMDFHRNFPLDLITEAQAVKNLIDAGLPKRAAYGQLSFVDDVEYVMDLLRVEEEEDLPLPDAPEPARVGYPDFTPRGENERGAGDAE